MIDVGEKVDELNNKIYEKSTNKTECSFCLEKLDNSRILECNHIFCLTCLLQLEDQQVNGKINCPICEIDNKLPVCGSLYLPTYIETINDVSKKFSEVQNNEIQIALECPICYEDLKSPIFLQCFHKFCLICVQKLEKKQLNGKIICPICRIEHMVTEDRAQNSLDDSFINQTIDYSSPIIVVPSVNHHLNNSLNQTNNESLITRFQQVINQQIPLRRQNGVSAAQNNNICKRYFLLIVFIIILILGLTLGLGLGIGLTRKVG